LIVVERSPSRSNRRRPVAPAVRVVEGGRERSADGLVLFGFLFFAFVEDAKEQKPGEIGDLLEGAGAVGAAEDVAGLPDGGVDGRLGSEGLRNTVQRNLSHRLDLSSVDRFGDVDALEG